MKPVRVVRVLVVVALLVAGSACRRPTDPDPLVGTFLAATFLVTPSGQGQANVLAAGGTLGVNVANNFVTAGTVIVPAAVTGGTALIASLAGTATRTESVVRFNQPAGSFVRDLTFTLAGDSLSAVDQTVGTTTYRIVLVRQ